MHPDLTGPSEFSETVALFFDVGLTHTSLAMLRSMADAGATVIPGHDRRCMEALPSRLV